MWKGQLWGDCQGEEQCLWYLSILKPEDLFFDPKSELHRRINFFYFDLLFQILKLKLLLEKLSILSSEYYVRQLIKKWQKKTDLAEEIIKKSSKSLIGYRLRRSEDIKVKQGEKSSF